MTRTVEVPEYEVREGVRLDPASTTLVIVDMQNDFVREGAALHVPTPKAPFRRFRAC